MRRLSMLVAMVAVTSAVVGSRQFRTDAQTSTPTATGQSFVGSWRITSESPAGTTQGLLTLMANRPVIFSGRRRRPAENPLSSLSVPGTVPGNRPVPAPPRPASPCSSPTVRGTSCGL